MLPQVIKQVTDVKSGAGFLSNLGVDKSFLGKQFNRFSPFLSKIPGMDNATATSMIDGISRSLPDASQGNAPVSAPRPSATIDRSRYPKIN